MQRWLLPLGLPYAGLMRLRAQSFAARLIRSWRPPGPTISVGNISWGGSGKTPLCEWLLLWSHKHNLRPLLLTRGYKARPGHYPFCVQADSPVLEAGDEPLMLFRATQAPVLVDPKRSRAGKWAATNIQPDLYILDDGFQHLAVQRDLDLVLMHPQDIHSQWNRVIPSGTWREGCSALKRASAFVFHMPPAAFTGFQSEIFQRLGHLDKPIFSFELQPVGFCRVEDQIQQSLFPDRPYLLVSGVGRPPQVESTATRFIGRKPVRHLIFPDHHPYRLQDWLDIAETARRLGSIPILCTPKDRVKLEQFPVEDLWSFILELRPGPAFNTSLTLSDWLKKSFSASFDSESQDFHNPKFKRALFI